MSFGDSPSDDPVPPAASSATDATVPRPEYFRRMSSESEALCVIAEDDSSSDEETSNASSGQRGGRGRNKQEVPGVSFPHARSMARQLSAPKVGREKAPKRGLREFLLVDRGWVFFYRLPCVLTFVLRLLCSFLMRNNLHFVVFIESLLVIGTRQYNARSGS